MRLTREPAADCINGNSVCPEPFGGERPNVIVARHRRPMLRQHLAAERVDLAERHRAEAARALQTKVEAAYASEEAEDAIHQAKATSAFTVWGVATAVSGRTPSALSVAISSAVPIPNGEPSASVI